jgi:hypothetical protein
MSNSLPLDEMKLTMNRKLPLLALALIILSACGVRWQTLDETGFTVQMPGTPNKQTRSANAPTGSTTINTYSAEAQGEAFIVSYKEYTAEMADTASSDPEQFLNMASQSAVHNVDGKITGQRSVTLNGKPGKEIVGNTTKPQEGTFIARIYWDSPRLYQVLYLRPEGAAVSENGEKFLNSFQLTGK